MKKFLFLKNSTFVQCFQKSSAWYSFTSKCGYMCWNANHCIISRCDLPPLRQKEELIVSKFCHRLSHNFQILHHMRQNASTCGKGLRSLFEPTLTCDKRRKFEQFLLLIQCFQKSSASCASKCVYMRERVKTFRWTVCDYGSTIVHPATDLCGFSHWSSSTLVARVYMCKLTLHR